MRIALPRILVLSGRVDLHWNETTCCKYVLYEVGPRMKAPGVASFSGEGRYERQCWCEDESYGPYGGDKECGGRYSFLEFLNTRVWFFKDVVTVRSADRYTDIDAIYDECEGE